MQYKRFGKVLAALAVLFLVFAAGQANGSGRWSWPWLNAGNSQNGSLPNQLDYSSVNDVYAALKANFDGNLDQAKLLDGIKTGLAEATGDPHTEYFNADQAKSFTEQLTGTFSGIGAELGKDSAGNLQVVAPIAGFPADKAGLKPGDLIIQIDGQSTTGIQVDDAVNKIRGPKGTTVTLQIVRAGQLQTIPIVRDNIKVPSVYTKVLAGNIGYIQITQFSDDTATLVTQAAQNFVGQGVKGVVLDLRSDPGGLVDAAVNVCSLWLPNGQTIMQEKRGAQVVQTYTAQGTQLFKGMPTVVLIDSGSASASEITAGALKDNGVASLIGTKSYGKGSVQTIINLSNGSELKVTIARWYRPNGQNIDKQGITPDQNVELGASGDAQLDAALAKLK